MADRRDRTTDVPTLSLDERDRRWAGVRERTFQRGLDALVVWSNDRFWGMAHATLQYLTHVTGTQGNAIGIFPLHGEPADSTRQHLLHGKPQPLSPTQRTLGDGDLLKTEFHANYGGYLTAVEKSVVLGEASRQLRDVHEVCLACAENAYPEFQPGTRLEALWEAFRAPAREAEMDFIELGFHGHGLASPEFPAVVYPQESTRLYPDGMAWHPASARDQEDIRHREGMVFGTNIDVHDPSRRDDIGLMYRDTILVTGDGPERLVGTPEQLVV